MAKWPSTVRTLPLLDEPRFNEALDGVLGAQLQSPNGQALSVPCLWPQQNLIIDIAVQGGQHAVRHFAFLFVCLPAVLASSAVLDPLAKASGTHRPCPVHPRKLLYQTRL